MLLFMVRKPADGPWASPVPRVSMRAITVSHIDDGLLVTVCLTVAGAGRGSLDWTSLGGSKPHEERSSNLGRWEEHVDD